MLRVGIGINVDMTDDVLSAIDQPATSLRQLLDTTPSVDEVLSVLTSKLKSRFLSLEENVSPIDDYRSKLLYKNEEIVIREGDIVMDEEKKVVRDSKGKIVYRFKETKGIFHDVTNQGFLILRPSCGDELIIASGEIVPRVEHDL